VMGWVGGDVGLQHFGVSPMQSPWVFIGPSIGPRGFGARA